MPPPAAPAAVPPAHGSAAAEPSPFESLSGREQCVFTLAEGLDGCYGDGGSGSEVEDADGCGETADSFHVVSACGRLYDLDPCHDASEMIERYQRVLAELPAQYGAIERAQYTRVPGTQGSNACLSST